MTTEKLGNQENTKRDTWIPEGRRNRQYHLRKLGACRWGRKRVKGGGKEKRVKGGGRKKENIYVFLHLDSACLAVVSWRSRLFLKRKQSREGIWGEAERSGGRGSCGLEVLYGRKNIFSENKIILKVL